VVHWNLNQLEVLISALAYYPKKIFIVNGQRFTGHNYFDPIQRGFINPFRPEDFIVRITANRRRWIHGFYSLN
jgi:hypothetical protein